VANPVADVARRGHAARVVALGLRSGRRRSARSGRGDGRRAACAAGCAARSRTVDGLRAHLPAASRLIAIADLHGDLTSARRALKLAGVIDDQDRWSGGDTVVVQVGDVLDRGDDEPALLALVDRLTEEAAAAGGAYVMLLGNHELMNASGDFRYVTAAGFAQYADTDGMDRDDPRVRSLPAAQRGRVSDRRRPVSLLRQPDRGAGDRRRPGLRPVRVDGQPPAPVTSGRGARSLTRA
jgi:Calcineurin-like phosphoesterase